tara:strand:- start:89 stop:292 length:204 start_codon:yes stop_codon:yes gene_type:complete
MSDQTASQKIVSPCKKMIFIIENDTTASAYHDFLLSEKGRIIDIMVKVQKDEEELTRNQKENCCLDE